MLDKPLCKYYQSSLNWRERSLIWSFFQLIVLISLLYRSVFFTIPDIVIASPMLNNIIAVSQGNQFLIKQIIKSDGTTIIINVNLKINSRMLRRRANTRNVSYTPNPTGEKHTISTLLIKPVSNSRMVLFTSLAVFIAAE